MWKKVITVFIVSIASLAGGFFFGSVNQSNGIAGLPALLGFEDTSGDSLAGKTVTTGNNIVNVYVSADKESEVVMSLPKNTEVQCINEDEPNWLYIQVMDGVNGYVPSVKMSLVPEGGSEEIDEPVEEEPTVTLVTPIGLYVNVRAQESQDSSIVNIALKGDTMEKLDENNGWLHVRLVDNSEGYVSAELMTAAEGTTPSSTPPQKVVVTNSFARIRAEATVSSTEIARLNRGESGIYLEEVDGWYHMVLADGQSGYVRNDLAEVQ